MQAFCSSWLSRSALKLGLADLGLGLSEFRPWRFGVWSVELAVGSAGFLFV